MNCRERVLKAFRRRDGDPDRVPIQFDLCRSLLDHFGAKLGIPVHYTQNLFEDVTYRISGNEVRLALGSDVVIVGPSEADGFQPTPAPDGTWTNEYGMRLRHGSIYVEVVDFPLAHIQTASDVAAYAFPDPSDQSRYRDAEQLIGKYKDDYFIIGDIELTMRVPPHDDEVVKENNQRTVPIAIREETLKVLLVESLPRWE